MSIVLRDRTQHTGVNEVNFLSHPILLIQLLNSMFVNFVPNEDSRSFNIWVYRLNESQTSTLCTLHFNTNLIKL